MQVSIDLVYDALRYLAQSPHMALLDQAGYTDAQGHLSLAARRKRVKDGDNARDRGGYAKLVSLGLAVRDLVVRHPRIASWIGLLISLAMVRMRMRLTVRVVRLDVWMFVPMSVRHWLSF
jgi:hypothetical protein